MKNHLNIEIIISPDAAAAALILFECAEQTHHINVNRTDIIEKLGTIDRHLAMQCIEDLKRITKSFKPVE